MELKKSESASSGGTATGAQQGASGATSGSSRVKYSICMCNYNMADTIERSLTSLLAQIDDRFEIVLVDDGSSDRSVEVALRLAERHPNLRVFSLKRDSKRKLGLTRNFSIENAVGEYVLLHLDCDDVFGPFLLDFVEVFHRLEACIGHDVLISGQHINMARRSFLLSHGPYRNLFRGEDRDLWLRLAMQDAYYPLLHVDFITRLPKSRSTRFRRALVNTFDHMRTDFRGGFPLMLYFRYEWAKRRQYSTKLKIMRWLMVFPAWVAARFSDPIEQSESEFKQPEAFGHHRDRISGTFSQIMTRNGCSGDLGFLRPEARPIFEMAGTEQSGVEAISNSPSEQVSSQ